MPDPYLAILKSADSISDGINTGENDDGGKRDAKHYPKHTGYSSIDLVKKTGPGGALSRKSLCPTRR
jgi:hypothetical protein